ncbi:hypothetical protein AJ79_04677 [Helicocarpus griseus UAMH5409]|uniref:Uncharacterized protein n=1 Tax=Helicocarpus griseus UAMH5409 TaxID=1447875 RepID=A0A2B7XRC1_9EURO|nr:hypothetical protein AJ79_04677 [Helicocarpus griseus UAMH5409]
MQQNKQQLINSLRTHRINTVIELRRVERALAQYDPKEVTEPLSNAWLHYVNSNNLLSELRSLTKNYPFSSECLDEAKALVVADPQRSRSWNYCWLVLHKLQEKQLIPKHAKQIAAKPVMWGGRAPTSMEVEQLSNAFVVEWTTALCQMLRRWDQPPVIAGR